MEKLSEMCNFADEKFESNLFKSMSYDKHIDKTEEELRKLREVYDQDSVDRFIDGLEAGQITSEAQVIEFTNKIRKNDGLTRLEYSRLERLKVGFIESYATNYNKRYSTTHMLMNKMRSGISRGLKMLEDFCEKKKRKGHSKSKRKVVENSKMGKGEYRPSIYGLEYYKESVKVLYEEVVNYTNDLTKCIDLCLYMTEQVNAVRANPERANEIYDKCHKDTISNHRSVIKRFISMNADMESDILKKMEEWERQKKSMKELRAKLYHTLDENEWNDLCISEEVMIARKQDITNEERYLWGDNKQQVLRVRVVFEHLDELLPVDKKYISGEFMARLFQWCNILSNRGLGNWYSYFYKNYMMHGKMTPRGEGAIKMAKKKIALLDSDEDKEQRQEFNQKLEQLLKKYMVEPTETTESMKDAVNF